MRALVFDQFGEPDVLEWREVAEPTLSAGTAIVRVAAAGLNFADVYRRRGNYHLDATPPWILGYEGAGWIETLPEGDTSLFRVGDRVGFADCPRANAERVAVPLDKLIAIPGDIDLEIAAALLLQGLTAQYLVSDSYRTKTGDLAVVHAAAGGVGLLLTQMLSARGLEVAALASSPRKRQAALDAGAAAAFDYDGDWPTRIVEHFGRGADVVYDSVGATLSQSMAAARIGGTVVFYGFAGGDPPLVDPRVLMDRSLTVTGGDLWNVLTSPDERRRRAEALFDMVRKGALKPQIAARVPMRDGADAHRLLEGRGVIGKVLLVIDED